MYLVISDLFRERPTEIAGSPPKVEEQIRKLFPHLLDHIPVGDLEEVLRVVNRMYGYSLVIVDASDYQKPTRPAIRRPVNDDPWEREGDLP